MPRRLLPKFLVSYIFLCTPTVPFAFQITRSPQPNHSTVRRQSADDHSAASWGSEDYWLQQIQKQGEERPEYQWFRERSSLPFECTACGKCCKTQGQVYMTPDEHDKASKLLGLSNDEFIQQYASHTLVDETNGDVWVRLIDETTGTDSGCVFLQEDNTCRIYEARPIQCSTYPFWPNILASRAAWNSEVRRADDDESSDLPVWTAEGGGCEGMQIVCDANEDEEPDGGVPLPKVYEQAYFYEHDDRRFHRLREIPVEVKKECSKN